MSQFFLEKTQSSFPHFQKANITPLLGSGSDRKFFRCQNPEGDSLIVISYSREKEENLFYSLHADFLKNFSISVPSLLLHEEEENLLWLEDLGPFSLYHYRDHCWEDRSLLYQKTLKEISKLHDIPLEAITKKNLPLQPAFNEELYLWEQSYFQEYLLMHFFSLPLQKAQASKESLKKIAKELSSLPKQLIHRDFQSQNIMIREGNPFFIDFQGMRLGLPLYDIASLLFDPYVSLTFIQKKELLDYYHQVLRDKQSSPPYPLESTFFKLGLQRIMQALGAYAFLSLKKGKKEYKNYIPTALKELQSILFYLVNNENAHSLEELSELTEELLESLQKNHL